MSVGLKCKYDEHHWEPCSSKYTYQCHDGDLAWVEDDLVTYEMDDGSKYGLVNIWYDEHFGSICDDIFKNYADTDEDPQFYIADMMCKELGYEKGNYYNMQWDPDWANDEEKEQLDELVKPIILDNGGNTESSVDAVNSCEGTEDRLVDCQGVRFGGMTDCQHFEDVTLWCFPAGYDGDDYVAPGEDFNDLSRFLM